MAKTVIVDIARGGAISAKVEGVAGPSCEQDLDWMEKLGQVVKSEPTADYARRPQEMNRNDQSQGQ